ncbi:MAG: hypothetical protein GY754_01855, partial [bacterium]|nr:hypothetical protein [bacterium]
MNTNLKKIFVVALVCSFVFGISMLNDSADLSAKTDKLIIKKMKLDMDSSEEPEKTVKKMYK